MPSLRNWDGSRSPKELVNNCLKSLVPDLFKDYFDTRHCGIHSYNTRSRGNLYIDKINLQPTERGFFYKGTMIFNRNF